MAAEAGHRAEVRTQASSERARRARGGTGGRRARLRLLRSHAPHAPRATDASSGLPPPWLPTPWGVSGYVQQSSTNPRLDDTPSEGWVGRVASERVRDG